MRQCHHRHPLCQHLNHYLAVQDAKSNAGEPGHDNLDGTAARQDYDTLEPGKFQLLSAISALVSVVLPALHECIN